MLRQTLISYIQGEYLYGSAEAEAACMHYMIPLLISDPDCFNSLAQQICSHTNPLLFVHLR